MDHDAYEREQHEREYLDPLEAEAVRVTAEADLATAKLRVMEENEALLRQANAITAWHPGEAA